MLEGYDLPPSYDEDGALVDEHPSWSYSRKHAFDGIDDDRPLPVSAWRAPARPMTRFRYATILGRSSVTDEEWARHLQHEQERADYEQRKQVVLPDPPPVHEPLTFGEVAGHGFGAVMTVGMVALLLLVAVVVIVLGWEFVSWIQANAGDGCHGKCHY